MNRSQFLGAILAPVALLFRRKEEKPNPVIKNSRFKELKIIQARIDFLKKYPLTRFKRRSGGYGYMIEMRVYKENKELIDYLMANNLL